MDTTNIEVRNIKNDTTSASIKKGDVVDLPFIIQEEKAFSIKKSSHNRKADLTHATNHDVEADEDKVSEEDKKDFYKKTFGQGVV